MWWWSVKKRWYESAMTFKYCNVASSQRCKVWHLPLLQCAQQQKINQPSFCLCQLAFRTLIITQTCIFHMTLSLISHKSWTEDKQNDFFYWFFNFLKKWIKQNDFFFFFFKEVNQTEWFFLKKWISIFVFSTSSNPHVAPWPSVIGTPAAFYQADTKTAVNSP